MKKNRKARKRAAALVAFAVMYCGGEVSKLQQCAIEAAAELSMRQNREQRRKDKR
jgi:hypothetical protein